MVGELSPDFVARPTEFEALMKHLLKQEDKDKRPVAISADILQIHLAYISYPLDKIGSLRALA